MIDRLNGGCASEAMPTNSPPPMAGPTQSPLTDDATLADRASRLFAYLAELAKLRLSTVRDCRDYEEILWFDTIPEEPECASIARSTDAAVGPWIRVERADEPLPPEPPPACTEWVDPTTFGDSGQPPRLRDSITTPGKTPDDPPVVLSLVDHPEVESAWDAFVCNEWKGWSQEHLRWASIQRVYDRLFAMHQMLKKGSETYEVIIGAGVLACQTPTGQRVFRHLLVGQANLSFDPHHGVLSVEPGADGVRLALEQDMLEADERPLPELQEICKKKVEEVSESPWPADAIEPALSSYAHALHGTFNGELAAPKEVSSIPTVTFAPAIILRKRTARSLVKLLDDIARQIAETGLVPFGVRRLCEIVGDESEGKETFGEDGALSSFASDPEIYFPLPANEEQFRIVRRLNHNQGVLVQGPPGTGKSHTIANLICHLLATGKRVLVTSQTPRALKVLEAKIPTELSALCVSVLGNDAGALKNLQNSVHGITDQQQTWDDEKNRRVIGLLEKRRDEIRRRVAAVESDIRQHRESETWQHRVAWGAYCGVASEIARRVTEERPLYEWLRDQFTEESHLPFAASDFLELLRALRCLPAARREEALRLIPEHGSLPDVAAFIQARDAEADASARVESLAGREPSARCKILLAAGPTSASSLVTATNNLKNAIAGLDRFRMAWMKGAVADILAGRARAWVELAEQTGQHLKGLMDRARRAHSREIVFPEGLNPKGILADARELQLHFSNGRGLGFFIFRSEVVRRTLYLTRTVRVNGRVSARPDILVELIEHLETQIAIQEMGSHWSGLHEMEEGPIVRKVTAYEAMQEALNSALQLRDAVAAVRGAIGKIPGLIEPNWEQSSELDALLADCEAAFARQRLANASETLNGWQRWIQSIAVQPRSHPVSEAFATSVSARDVRGYASAHHDWETLRADAKLLSCLSDWEAALAAVAPQFARLLDETHLEDVWDVRMADVEKAWAWARARSWLDDFLARGDATMLEEELRSLLRQQGETIAKLAAAKAWQKCFERMTEPENQHLRAWTQAIRRIGRGTGVRVEQHRRDAQQHLDSCRQAVPAWVMPFHRVAETVTAQAEAFDVIIVDEASQSGPEALALLYLGKQIVVVGDDEQISPEGVGVSRDAVDSLGQQYLEGIPHRDALGITSSLFHQAAIRFGGRVVLREHFRCMPEIIRFSSDLCYHSQLEPLRQYPPQRLEPIIVCHVSDGYREGTSQSARNPREAEAIVDAICGCNADPVYAGKTMGVISLQGESQAKLVNSLLLKRLTPEEIEDREIVCGDAYAFQGDERDVMFLSMVAAPNAQFQALTTDAARQRFNVAASRARDQVRLYHSVTLNELNPADMRYRLLAYYLNPGESSVGGPDWERCDSEFEREVGRRILERGFRVVPQFEPFGPNSYRIDFVVEGARTRLAVECDGPHHDETEQIEQDLVRQRQLERCGWHFWRLSASAFYANRERSLESLWRKLDAMGIAAVGTNTVSSPPAPARETRAQRPGVLGASSPRMVQQRLIPDDEMELFASQPAVCREELLPSMNEAVDSDAELVNLVARLRAQGCKFTKKEIGPIVLAAIPSREKVPIRGVVSRLAELLRFSRRESEKIEEVIDQLASEGVLVATLVNVWRKPN